MNQLVALETEPVDAVIAQERAAALASAVARLPEHYREVLLMRCTEQLSFLDYAPDVERSKIESREGDHFRVFLRFRRHKVITVVLNTEHEVQYFHDGPGKAHSRSSAARIAELENPGKSDEREKIPGDDGGFMWRMETWWRMEEHDGGVYVQSEVASLTRDIPTGLGWMIKPFVTGIPKESLTFTLEATRKAVAAHLSAR